MNILSSNMKKNERTTVKINKKNLVSVIIPSYKNVDSLDRAVKSVLNQTYKNIEIIVVDDNKPDSTYRKQTERLMQKYIKYDNVKYVKNEKNLERSYSRNRGVFYSEGEYIAFLDNDDEYLPGKIGNQVQRLKEMGTGYVVCYSSYVRKIKEKNVCFCGEFREGNLRTEILARDFPIHPGSNLLLRKEIFEKCGGFCEFMSQNEDIDLLIRLLDYGSIACDKKMGLIVHLHEKEKGFDFESITRAYYIREKKYIDSLDREQSNLVRQVLGLQLIKYYIRYPRKFTKIRKEWKINTILMFRYFMYLGVRVVNRKAYGFIK